MPVLKSLRSQPEIGFFNTSGVAKVCVSYTMDATMDIAVRNLRFRNVCSKHEKQWQEINFVS